MITLLKLNRLSRILVLAVWLMSLTGVMMTANHVQAAGSYYVDCSAPTNGNGSQSSPWNNLTTVNTPTFGPGDQILFKRGATCTGTLSFHGSGASGSPIVVDGYGVGNKPLLAGAGATEAIYLYNQQYLELRNLEVTNTGATASNRRGIYLVLENFGVGNYYRLLNLTVHNVNGADQKNGGGSAGILLEVKGSSTPTKFNDVLIDGNTVYTVDRSGIMTWSTYLARPEISYHGAAWYPATNVVIQNNLVYDIGGDGIIPHMSDGALIQNNIVHDFNARSAGPNVAMWGWDVNNLLVQFNEAYTGGPNGNLQDSEGYDVDEANTGTTIQYNYSHANNGGFVLVCDGRNSVISGAQIRYNLSQNDRNTIVNLHCYRGLNTLFYNNTLYAGPTSDDLGSGYIIFNNNNSKPEHIKFYNNIFYNDCPGCTYKPDTSNPFFNSNIFYGYAASNTFSASDANVITSNPLLVAPGSGGFGINSVSGYQLQAGSPAINSGANLVALGLTTSMGTRDYFGNLIPANGVFDRGAHEASGGGPTPTATATSAPTNTPTVGPSPTPTRTSTPGPTPTHTNTPAPTATPGGSTVMHVADIYTADVTGTPKTVFIAGDTIYWRVKIVDQSGNPVSNAFVTTQLLKPDGSVWNTQTHATGADGWVVIQKSTAPSSPLGVYTINVTNVTKTGATYDPAANVKSSTTFTLQ